MPTRKRVKPVRKIVDVLVVDRDDRPILIVEVKAKGGPESNRALSIEGFPPLRRLGGAIRHDRRCRPDRAVSRGRRAQEPAGLLGRDSADPGLLLGLLSRIQDSGSRRGLPSGPRPELAQGPLVSLEVEIDLAPRFRGTRPPRPDPDAQRCDIRIRGAFRWLSSISRRIS